MALLRMVVGFSALSAVVASSLSSSAQSVNTWRRRAHGLGGSVGERNVEPRQSTSASFPELFFSQPLDHFSNSLNITFGQRYWVNARHYVKGGPVIVLDGGEASASLRLPILDTGIVDILTNATNGLGIVLEHRYYGASIPVQNFSTDALRWLNNAQALQDSARFAANFRWNGEDLSAPNTKWIYYGGSYAGARAAHVRVLFGDLIYGSLASSAVTHAAINFWEYNEAIRTTANQTCISLLTTAVAYIDDLLKVPADNTGVKSLFGLSGLDDQDFASAITDPIDNYVQAQNWDPQVGSDVWPRFCQTLGSGNANSSDRSIQKSALLSNYAQWIREGIVKGCTSSIVGCFGTGNDTQYQDIGLSQIWRAWQWQVCTEWGYFIGAPPDTSYPTIVSRTLTLEYTSKICRQAFPPGQYAQVPAWPNVTAVNSLGGFFIAKDRLAFIDGEQDPWRPATPHSWYAPNRSDTPVRPFKMIKAGVHHYDENGLKDHTLEPQQIQQIHAEEVTFVKSWLNL